MKGITLKIHGFEVVPLHEQHLKKIARLMNEECWYYYDRYELKRYLQLQQDCFALLKNGQVIGSIFSTTYENQAWIGNIIVAQEFRGMGLATQMLRGLKEYLHDKRNVLTFRLGSVPLAIGLYKRLGFRAEAFTTAQTAELPIIKELGQANLGKSISTEKLKEHQLKEAAAIDALFFKSNREYLLAGLYNDSIKEACLCLKDGHEFVGFLMIRRRKTSKAEGGFTEGPDYVYRLGPSCVLPEYGLEGFKALLQKALPVVNDEVHRLGGSARMYVVFPRNSRKEEIYNDTRMIAQGMGKTDDINLDAVFDEHNDLFGAQLSKKNEGQWKFMEQLGFHQEYFEQVMSCSLRDHSENTQSRECTQNTRTDPEGIFASATPGDKA